MLNERILCTYSLCLWEGSEESRANETHDTSHAKGADGGVANSGIVGVRSSCGGAAGGMSSSSTGSVTTCGGRSGWRSSGVQLGWALHQYNMRRMLTLQGSESQQLGWVHRHQNP